MTLPGHFTTARLPSRGGGGKAGRTAAWLDGKIISLYRAYPRAHITNSDDYLQNLNGEGNPLMRVGHLIALIRVFFELLKLPSSRPNPSTTYQTVSLTQTSLSTPR